MKFLEVWNSHAWRKSLIGKLGPLVFNIYFFIAKREETKWASVAFLLEEDNSEKSKKLYPCK